MRPLHTSSRALLPASMHTVHSPYGGEHGAIRWPCKRCGAAREVCDLAVARAGRSMRGKKIILVILASPAR